MNRSPAGLSLTAFLAAAIVLVGGGQAAGWDPDETDEPIGVPFEPPPFEVPEALLLNAPSGIYRVADAYTGDYVSHEGPVTTYGTATVHGLTDTYARVIDTVETGAGSIFDGAAFNGRSSLIDGRPVAGTYYESFFLTDAGYVSFGIVFFQDDNERLGTPPVSGPRFETPAAVRVEVLRGRRVEIWLTKLPSGAVWHFIGGEAVVLGPREGAAGDPFVARWDRLAAPGAAWALSFEITAAGAPARALTVEVTVRSPGLVE